jgi:maltose/moltooligosaccharide transporter
LSAGTAWRDFVDAVREMPAPMRQFGVAMLFQWYGMFCYWRYVTLSLARSLHGSDSAAALRDATLVNGRLGGFYNFLAFLAAFALVPLIRRLGVKPVHAVSIALGGVAMLALPHMGNEAWSYLPMIGIGIAWASLMGSPYVLLANSIPAERTGIYMGIFNMFIVVPMLIQTVTMPLLYGPCWAPIRATCCRWPG